jgi:hypothetical protein
MTLIFFRNPFVPSRLHTFLLLHLLAIRDSLPIPSMPTTGVIPYSSFLTKN